jgi:hypothetical protein
VKASITQASALSADVNAPATLYTFPLSGTITLTNPCFPSGSATLTIDNTKSYVSGEFYAISANSADGTINFSVPAQLGTILPDPTAATSMNVQEFDVTGACSNLHGTQGITLNKS